MNIRRTRITLIFASCLSCSWLSLGNAAAIGDSGQPPIYVEPLNPALAQDSSSDDTGASRRTVKVERNAAALTEALIRALNARGVNAYALGKQDPTPHTGWVITGVFIEDTPKGLLFSGLRSLGSSTPNTEVEISISDLGSGSDKPAKTISTAASLGGQGSAVSLNPYEAAAKLVIHHVASDRSIDDLARRLADQIITQRAPGVLSRS